MMWRPVSITPDVLIVMDHPIAGHIVMVLIILTHKDSDSSSPELTMNRGHSIIRSEISRHKNLQHIKNRKPRRGM